MGRKTENSDLGERKPSGKIVSVHRFNFLFEGGKKPAGKRIKGF